ncbi:hypothetical protein SAMN05428989_3683 [Pseudoxanthomonas sp. GM95]|uniref:hypothetical protein n=1 Tax=Pseudoxanthomonas sp. GM95 TaxID=1881043 RepID=UPI0008BF9B67|nr:hypothetical protein [Pseudoxanthomonas sp. GM95]SEM37845.1 hypothetical protein SAMN05428989_3683 [Pseudoxanthomonas sp. GM95]
MKALISAVLLALSSAVNAQAPPKLMFQTDQGWSPRVNVPADTVLAYGLDSTLPARIADWRAHGYRVGVMTALAWGRYPRYLAQAGDALGDETQQAAGGRALLHDGPQVPYFVPTPRYVAFLADGVREALEAGAESVYLEEPEFWADAGWSPAFKQAWLTHFGTPWQPPDASLPAQAHASQLKVALYRDAVAQACAQVHAWGQAHGRAVACNVATHSLLNYAQWRIVSPQHAFVDAGVDGVVGQVWTGTARAPNTYRGVQGERPFATAFLEFGALHDLARTLDVPAWWLADPVEDNPAHIWRDYRDNWQATLVASLMWPGNAGFEVLPWPNRIFDLTATYPDEHGGRHAIPAAYQRVLQTVFHALDAMPGTGQWQVAGTRGLGVLTSDGLMAQRAAPATSDPLLGEVHGLALPLLLHGMPVQPVSVEQLAQHADTLAQQRVLLWSQQGQGALEAKTAARLADWVRTGGALLRVDDAATLGDAVHDALFEALGVTPEAGTLAPVGRGVVGWLRATPVALSHASDGADRLRTFVQQAAARIALPWQTASALVMQRGPYVIAAGLQVPQEDAIAPTVLNGRYLDLLQSDLPELQRVVLQPGDHRLLLDLDATHDASPRLLAAGGRTTALERANDHLRFALDGIEGRGADDAASVVLALPEAPHAVTLEGKPLDKTHAVYRNGLLRLRVPAHARWQQLDIALAGGR